MKRIIKETLKDGAVQYRVEKKTTLFGWTIRDWHTDCYFVGFHNEIKVPAIFRSMPEAQKFCGIDINPIINKEIIL